MIKSLRLIPLQPEPFDTAMGGTFDICSNQEKVKNKIVRFVNLARLSAEKNQAEMIKAFARLAQEQPNVMLYIIGQGPERKNLENLIRKKSVTRKSVDACPFDRHAVMLAPKEVICLMENASFVHTRKKYITFFSKQLASLRIFEKWLRWCSFGAQHMETGRK